MIRTVGLSDEFTIFSVFCMRKWSDAENEILKLAKSVRGWGRIHCIDFIEAENAETKEWLFFKGVDNDVVPAYSAWPVYEKSDFIGRFLDDRNDPNVIAMYRFQIPITLTSGKNGFAYISTKEVKIHGNRTYTIELLSKPYQKNSPCHN